MIIIKLFPFLSGSLHFTHETMFHTGYIKAFALYLRSNSSLGKNETMIIIIAFVSFHFFSFLILLFIILYTTMGQTFEALLLLNPQHEVAMVTDGDSRSTE